MSKLVFITGASSGLGQAMAMHYHTTWLSTGLGGAPHRGDQIGWSTNGISADSYQIYKADVADSSSLAMAAAGLPGAPGLPDVVIANAGISIGVDSSRPEDIAVMARILSTNVVGVAATFGPFINAMLARGSGTLVGIGSVAGIRGLPGHGGYCASKAAVISYCESLRGELRGSGVKVVTICPGYIATPLTQNNSYSMPFLMQADVFAAKQALTPLKRK
jgi:NADP-dependent 3-hydroxy acid dehydrogenase YdfG